MNEKNVAALAELLHEIIPNTTYRFGTATTAKGPASECDFCQDAARKLASRGVLVPSALTEEEGNSLPVFGHDEAIIAELERIAKGED